MRVLSDSAPRFHSSLFTYNKGSKSFVAEASTITCGGRRPMIGRLYDDAIDVGLILTSARTGRSMRFWLKEEKCDNEGDLIVTIFQVDAADARRYMVDTETTVHVLND